MSLPTPPSVDDALRLARMNLRSRLMSLAARARTMDARAIEIFHDRLDQVRDEIRTVERRAHRDDQ